MYNQYNMFAYRNMNDRTYYPMVQPDYDKQRQYLSRLARMCIDVANNSNIFRQRSDLFDNERNRLYACACH
jgi:hypothetical protein